MKYWARKKNAPFEVLFDKHLFIYKTVRPKVILKVFIEKDTIPGQVDLKLFCTCFSIVHDYLDYHINGLKNLFLQCMVWSKPCCNDIEIDGQINICSEI